jgi:hypothetical protein
MANISLTLYTDGFFVSVLKSPTQMGSLSVNNSVTNISRLGTFKDSQAWDSFKFFWLKSKPYMNIRKNFNSFCFRLFIVRNCILTRLFVYFTKIIVCAGWAYAESILHGMLSIRKTNFCVCSASIQILSVFIWTSKRMLCQRGTDFIACWTYMETILSLVEHTWKWFHCWLSISENDFLACWANREIFLKKRGELHYSQSISTMEG